MLAFDPRPLPSHATNPSQTATLETEICGQRLSTARAVNEPRRRSKRLRRPTVAAASRGNVVLFCGGGNHARTCGLPGCGRSPQEPVCGGRIFRIMPTLLRLMF